MYLLYFAAATTANFVAGDYRVALLLWNWRVFIHSSPYHTAPDRTLPDRTTPYRTAPDHTRPNRTRPRPTKPYRSQFSPGRAVARVV